MLATVYSRGFAQIAKSTYTELMDTLIRKVDDGDLATVLRLNDAAVPHVNRIDLEQMRWFANNAHYFSVATTEFGLVGFLIGLYPGLDYLSPNYQWFCDNYDNFIYVDRVVVDDSAQGSGLGSMLYNDFAALAPDKKTVMTCEVNIRPANELSMQFHLRRGFRQVGSQVTDGGNKEVALLEKTL